MVIVDRLAMIDAVYAFTKPEQVSDSVAAFVIHLR